ncbi:MAG: YceI family protein [Sphingobacteriales bacterium]
MKKLILLILLLTAGSYAFAQYKPVDQGSSLQFTIKNFGFDVTGSFTGLKGSIKFDPQNVTESSFDVTIDANTVNTDNSLRDSHLRDNTYFDVKNYPVMRFVSSKVTANDGGYVIAGKLTIKKQTRDISFPFTASPSADGYLFKGSFKINRKDFDVGGTSTISNELEVSLNIIAKK